MLIQNSKGQFVCEEENFKTTDVFDFLEHAGVEFRWGVKLSDRTSLDLYAMLGNINYALNNGDIEQAYDVIQSATLLLVNASSNEVDEFIEEAVIRAEGSDMIRSIEEMLKNE